MKKIVWLSLMVVSFGMICGCNTVKGFGEDMQQGGQNIQKAANDNQKDN